MPELYEPVLLYDRISEDVTMGHLSHIGGDSYQWNIATTGMIGLLYFHDSSFDRISHWMPLPEPPDDEKKGVDWDNVPEVMSPDEIPLFYKNACEDV
jgi:hypothetical protein